MTRPLLEVRNLSIAFGSKARRRRVVDGISFSISPGEQLGLVGESGSGKSVSMLATMGLLPASAHVTADLVRLGEHDLTGATERTWAKLRGTEISMVFQNPMTSLNPSIPIGRQIFEPVEIHDRGKSTEELRHLAIDMLNEVAVPNPALRATQYPHEFSGGMRQRAVIAMALAGQPRMIVADEPTTALDVTVQAQIVSLMKDLAERHHVASVVITHDLGLVADMVDRVIIMYAGRIVEETPVDALFDGPAHPYTRALLESRPVTGKRRARLNAIPGLPPTSADAVPGCPFHPRCSFSKGRDICRTERPALMQVADGRRSACHFFEEVLAADEASATTAAASFGKKVGEIVLSLDGATRHYGSVKALNEVSLELRRGETLGIAGESGCGKSTLARIAMGLVKPTAGRVEVKGRDIAALKGKALRTARRDIQMVFQDPTSSLDRRMRVGPIIAEPMRIAGMRRKAIDRRIGELMQAVGLAEHYRNAYPFELSGGQRQRVGIARALALNPDVIIFDEPTSALDVSIQAQIVNLLDDLRETSNAGYVFIAHDLGVLRHVSNRIAVMYLGRIVETGPTEDIFGNPRHPYTRALLASAPVDHPRKRRTGKFIVQGSPPDPANIPSGCSFRNRCPMARDVCASTRPELEAYGSGEHLAACHFAADEEALSSLSRHGAVEPVTG